MTAASADSSCIFCRIIASDLPAQVVYRDDAVVAFLDTRPLFFGHTLVVPADHVETLTDLDPESVGPLFERVQFLAGAVRDGTGATGTFVAMNNKVSQSVPHLHVHVVPRTKGDGLRGFFWPRTTYRDDDHAATVAAEIGECLSPQQ